MKETRVCYCLHCRQVTDCVEIDSWWIQLRRTAEVTARPRSLCVRRDSLVWWPVCTFWFLGSYSAFVGPQQVFIAYCNLLCIVYESNVCRVSEVMLPVIFESICGMCRCSYVCSLGTESDNCCWNYLWWLGGILFFETQCMWQLCSVNVLECVKVVFGMEATVG